MQKQNNTPEDIKPDLKHDTMEYSAATDGNEIIDADLVEDEDGELSAEELELIEATPVDEQAAALNSVESDRQADDDVIFDANDTDEEYDDESGEETEERRTKNDAG